MLSIFLGLSLAHFLGLAAAFWFGTSAHDAGPSDADATALHLAMAIGAGFLTTITHCVVYVYFMATTKWLRAATDKAGLNKDTYFAVSHKRKKYAFFCLFIAVGFTMLTMFAGAATQTHIFPAMPGRFHLFMAIGAIVINLIVASRQLSLILDQGHTMDQALVEVNKG